MNINSIRPTRKHTELKELLHTNHIDLLGLTDARSLDKCSHFKLQKTLDATVLISPNHSSRTGGVALVIKNPAIKPTAIYHSNDQRAMLVNLEWKSIDIQILLLYCPTNQAKRTAFLQTNLPLFLQDHTITDTCLVLGDFNFSHDSNIKPARPIDLQHFAALESALQTQTILDVHQHFFPSTKEYSFVSTSQTPFTYSRIDRIYSSCQNLSHISKSRLIRLSPSFSDHSHCQVISLIHKEQRVLGRSFWKLNPSLLDRPKSKAFLPGC